MKNTNWLKILVRYARFQRQYAKNHHVAWRERLEYLRDYQRVARLLETENRPEHLVMHPRLGERTPKTPFDSHYFYQDIWAFRRIVACNPTQHVDIGSRVILVGLLSVMVPVEFVDVRPLDAKLPNFISKKGDLLELPYEDQSLDSVSCLHVAEHVGLGRYGDSMDVLEGTHRACAELQRVLKPGGRLYFGLPVARDDRIEFNGHRIHTVNRILSYFPDLQLVELSGVTDQSEFVEHIDSSVLNRQRYACGLFLFRRE
jgi:SAM-dependent methyltransferase